MLMIIKNLLREGMSPVKHVKCAEALIPERPLATNGEITHGTPHGAIMKPR